MLSAEMMDFWAANGGFFCVGKDLNGHQRLVDAFSTHSKKKALANKKRRSSGRNWTTWIETEAMQIGLWWSIAKI